MKIYLIEEVECFPENYQEELSFNGEFFFVINKVYLEVDYKDFFVGIVISPLDEFYYVERFIPCNDYFELSDDKKMFIKKEIKKYFEKKYCKNEQFKIIERNEDIFVKREIPEEYI